MATTTTADGGAVTKSDKSQAEVASDPQVGVAQGTVAGTAPEKGEIDGIRVVDDAQLRDAAAQEVLKKKDLDPVTRNRAIGNLMTDAEKRHVEEIASERARQDAQRAENAKADYEANLRAQGLDPKAEPKWQDIRDDL